MSNTLYPQMKFQVQEQIVDTKSLLDETNFYHQRQGTPDELTKKITYILGSYKRNYPISLMTMGGGGFGVKTEKEIDDVQFTYPVMGRKDKAVIVSSNEYSDGDKPGLGNGRFFITFQDNWIKRSYVIQSERGTMAYVHSDGVPVSGGYRYELELTPAGPSDYCPHSQLEAGVKWVELFTKVAESQSRSTESKMIMPGKFKNQMGFSRAGIQWAGNTANKFMKIDITLNGKTTNVWMDYAMWQFEERWLNECEHDYWYSRYNRLNDGTIPLKDALTSKVIPMGSGILEQITNKSTYSELTYDTLANRIGDALYQNQDSDSMTITLMTGKGGLREFDRAMKEKGAQILGDFGKGNIADKFVTGTGRSLAIGGFFDTFYHVDGYTIKVKHNPLFDYGRVALASPLHPVSGLPLESYRMVFLDDNDVDGQPNVVHVAQRGRSFIEGVKQGLTPTPRSIQILGGQSGNRLNLGSVEDQSEYTRMKSCGIQIMRANRCFDLQCVAGL